jgi:tetratricopeptide (TPR) repeat protein
MWQYQGKWGASIERAQGRLNIRYQEGNLQGYSNIANILAENLLELNRFAGHEDLSEAENALKLSIEIYKTGSKDALSLLAILSARQKRFTEAEVYYGQALALQTQHPKKYLRRWRYFRYLTEFELAFAQAHWDEAVIACEKILQLNRETGHRWRWARHLIDLGDALLERAQPGDRERAREAYQQSLEMFTQMGAPGYIQVLEERLAKLDEK